MSAKNLVIVESPTKVKSISKFLGKDYKVMASVGHVRDLPKSKMGIDIEGDFEPTYEVSPDKKKVISGIKKEIGKDTQVWIATDEDREGEAIGWHLVQALKLKKSNDVKRIKFNEITKPAVLAALDKPGDIDQNLVNAQQARRVLDRLVGYELSPLLWKKIKFGLSAGRVQSVAVRLIVDREREIKAFDPEEYWTVTAFLDTDKKEEAIFEAKLTHFDGKKIKLGSEKETNEVLEAIEGKDYKVEEVEESQAKRNPAPPFTTSTLQQEAARKLRFSVKKTMMLAQRLYEGVDLGSGHEGLITYMRTDSVNLSQTALSQAKELILSEFGEKYALDAPRRYKGRKGAQEAHEAIRPTDLRRKPSEVKDFVEADMFKLYELIWKRAVACQMQPAVLDKVGANVSAGKATFRATGQRIAFPGFMKLYLEGHDGDGPNDDEESFLPELKKGQELNLEKIDPKQHFTKPPARYTEASLVKKLEAEGIGRPSTYAPTISTVQARGYIEKEGRQLKPTEIGTIVTDFLVEHFSQIVDVHFTVKMEDMLDEVEEGKETWKDEVREFYGPFHKLVSSKEKTVSRESASQVIELGEDPKSGKPVSVRIGRYGPFVQIGTKEDEEKPRFAALPKGVAREDLTLEAALKLFNLPRELGVDEAGETVKANVGRFGPYVQVGKSYFSIKEDDPYTITLERALEVVKEEKERKAKAQIQVFEEDDIQVLEGRYGPYIKSGKSNFKIPKDKDPKKLTLEECKEIIAAGPTKRRFKKKK